MADKWDGDTMSVELAIQRELAYRRRLTLQLKPDDDLLKDLIPLQVQSSSPSPSPNLEHPSSSNTSPATKRKEPPSAAIPQTPPVFEKQQSFHRNPMTETAPADHRLHCLLCNLVFSNDFSLEQHLSGQKHWAKLQQLLEHPSPSNVLSGTKRKEPVSAFQTPPGVEKQPVFCGNPMAGSTQTDNGLYCKLCSVECSSDFNLKQHMNGQKHQGKLQELAKGQRRWCEVCKIPCMNEVLLKMHLEGRKHKHKLLELNLSRANTNDDSTAKPRSFYCKLCQIWCIDEFSFKQHLEGKKHRLLLFGNFPKPGLEPSEE